MMKGVKTKQGDALTGRQRDVLEFVRSYRIAHGRSPTIREIGDAFRISSPNGVCCHLKALCSKGAITWHPQTARSIWPTDEHSAPKLLGDILDFMGVDGVVAPEFEQRRESLCSRLKAVLGVR